MKMDSQPLVYIIVLNWNGRSDTEECLESLRKSKYQNCRVLVVDNGSTDGSVDSLSRLFPDVEFLRNESNVGFAEGNNQGIAYARKSGAGYIFILNNDTIVFPDVLNILVQVLQEHEDIAAVGPKICYYSNPDRIWCLGGRLSFFLGCTWHVAGRRRDGVRYRGTRDVGYLSGCAILIRNRALEEVGCFDPTFSPAYFEDTDLSIRIRQKGYRLVCVEEAKILHKVSQTSGGAMTPLKTYLKIRNGGIFFRRYARPVHWLTLPFAYIGDVVLTSCFAMLRGRPKIAAAAWRGLHDSFTKGRLGMEFQSSVSPKTARNTG